MSFSQGAVINASTISRDCQISRKTVDSYLLILEDLLLAFQLPVFRFKAKRELSSHQKFYYFDCGVYQSLRPQNLFDVETRKGGGRPGGACSATSQSLDRGAAQKLSTLFLENQF